MRRDKHWLPTVVLLGLAASCGSFGASEAPGTPGDAAAPDGGAGGAFCPRAGTFVCEDFEAPAGFRFSGWTRDDEAGRNRIAVEEMPGATSSSHALHVVAEPGASTPTDAYLEAKSIDAARVTLEADVRIEATSTHRAIIAAVQRNNASPSLRLRSTGEIEERTASGDGGSDVTSLASITMPRAAEWARIALSVDVDAHAGKVTVGDQTKTFALGPAWSRGPLEARIGLVDASPDARWDLFVDDVIVTVE